MSTLRSARTVLRRAAGDCGCTRSMSVLARRAPASILTRAALPVQSSLRPSVVPSRAFSATAAALRKVQRDVWAKDPIITYDELKKITQQPGDKILVIDVRDDDEVVLGTIPSSVNLPLPRLEEALSEDFNPGEFQHEFAFKKPLPNQNIVFFCRTGRRSATACELANKVGYPNTRNYLGSWVEWSEKEAEAHAQ